MKLIMIAALMLVASGARAQTELTLNDLPGILYKLRGCTEEASGFIVRSTTTSCRVPSSDLWASVDSAGSLTLFRKRSYGDTTYANGKNVPELLRDFARRINDDNATNKIMLEALAPFLPSQ